MNYAARAVTASTLPSPEPFRARSGTVVPGARDAAARERRRSIHDSLHMMSGLGSCWCMCVQCWVGFVVNNKQVGRCICPECPCRQTRL